MDDEPDALWICISALDESVPTPILVAVNTPTVVIPDTFMSLTRRFGLPDKPVAFPVTLPVNAPTNPPVEVVTPDTFNLDICAVNIVAADDTFTSSRFVVPSTSKSPFASTLPVNVDIPVTVKFWANALKNTAECGRGYSSSSKITCNIT